MAFPAGEAVPRSRTVRVAWERALESRPGTSQSPDAEERVTPHQVRELVTVSDEEMLPLPRLFLHKSALHGLSHVGRVMVHALRLIEATGFVQEAPRLWAAVYLHDIARTHDGAEPGHGRAASRLADLPEIRGLFLRGGVREEDFAAVRAAVSLHSRGEAVPSDAHARLTHLLKDADGLDRVRILDLDARYLRFPQARTMVGFARQLFDETDGRCPLSPAHFACIWREALRLAGAQG